MTFSFPASAASLELVRGLSRKSRCSLRISQLDGFSVSRSLLLEVHPADLKSSEAEEMIMLLKDVNNLGTGSNVNMLMLQTL